MKIYNSLTRKIEPFEPLNSPNVSMYTCGQTVYDYTHIGHGRKYVNDDLLRRTLTLLGYKVTHVQNVTDVGHLVSDNDYGEDKLEKGARKTGKTVWQVAKFFTEHFYKTLDKLNVLRPNIICRATDHIKEQIELVQKLTDKGYAYDTPEAVYFDISRFKNYGMMLGQKQEEKRVAVRKDVQRGEHKRNPADFALWFKRVGRFRSHVMHWESPWGDGFPGWHIECSAMSMKYLGETIDIHTGGEDHLSVHHPNEIAQSETATGKKFVQYWVHHAFLIVEGRKMSKSLGNIYRIEDLEEKGFSPMALRYLYLTVHYRQKMNFTFEALKGAAEAFNSLRSQLTTLKQVKERVELSEEKLQKIEDYRNKFQEAIENDLNLPQALSIAWEVLKSNVPSADKYDLLSSFNEVFGLSIEEKEIAVPQAIKKLADKRLSLRKEGKFTESDKLRQKIEKMGYKVEDTDGSYLIKIIKPYQKE